MVRGGEARRGSAEVFRTVSIKAALTGGRGGGVEVRMLSTSSLMQPEPLDVVLMAEIICVIPPLCVLLY